VSVVGRPPLLRIGHERSQVGLDRGEIERLECGRVVEVVVHRVGLGRTLMQDVQVQLVRPPVLVRRTTGCCVWILDHRAFAFVSHLSP